LREHNGQPASAWIKADRLHPHADLTILAKLSCCRSRRSLRPVPDPRPKPSAAFLALAISSVVLGAATLVLALSESQLLIATGLLGAACSFAAARQVKRDQLR
jgi:hypothetical protein